jgi:hypothetical protein
MGLATPAAAQSPPDTATIRATGSGIDTTAVPLAAPAVVETTGVVTVPRVARQPRTLPQQSRYDQPKWVMLRSLALPGWGQAHNRSWLKALAIGTVDAVLRVRVIRDQRNLNQLDKDTNASLAALGAAAEDTTAAGIVYRTYRDRVTPPPDADTLQALQTAYGATYFRIGAAAENYNDIVGIYNALLDESVSRMWLLGGVLAYSLIDAYVDAHFRNFDVDFEIDPALPGKGGGPGGRIRLRWSF